MKFSCGLFVLSSLCAFSSFAATDPLIGKWKTSQNQSAQNQAGVVCGLRTGTHPEALAMAALIEAQRSADSPLSIPTPH